MDSLETIIAYLNRLYGLPAVVLVAISCIVWGYALKFIKRFPNESIPLAVLGWGAFWLPLLSEYTPGQMRLQIIRNIFIGLISAFLAWMLHDKVLKKIEDKLGLFADDSQPPPQNPAPAPPP